MLPYSVPSDASWVKCVPWRDILCDHVTASTDVDRRALSWGV